MSHLGSKNTANGGAGAGVDGKSEDTEMEKKEEIVFMDVETTVPWRPGQGFALLEFGAILVCPRKLMEIGCYSTLIRPADLSAVSTASVRCNGITRDALAFAPSFSDVADRIYDILHGRIWAGHNIMRFDCVRIREAFSEIGRPAPEPRGTMDSLALLKQRFGRRAGNMKMATLANYFGLGQQKHRSLDDVRMNFEVVKHCATVLFLESCLPDVLVSDHWASPNTSTPNHSYENVVQEASTDPLYPSILQSRKQQVESPLSGENRGEIFNISETVIGVAASDPFNFIPLMDRMNIDSSLPSTPLDERTLADTLIEITAPDVPERLPANDVASEGCSGYAGFLDSDEVSIPCIGTSVTPSYRGGSRRIMFMHKNALLQLRCMKMKIRFGVSTKFVNHAGQPRLSIVVEPSPSVCQVLDACDHLAQQQFMNSGSNSTWRPSVIRKTGYLNLSTIRLQIPTVANGDTSTYSTEIYQKEPSGNVQKLVFSKVDAAELDVLFIPGTYVDAYFSLVVYDYQQHAGIRLVAKKLIAHSK